MWLALDWRGRAKAAGSLGHVSAYMFLIYPFELESQTLPSVLKR
jgi:hypothetical protein